MRTYRIASVALALGAAPAVARAESAPPPPEPEAVDLLVVVDHDQAMADELGVLSAAVDDLVAELLREFPGEYGPAIDLHVGVITADSGALRTADPATCLAAPTGAFIEHAYDPWGDLIANHGGTLDEAIRCLLPAPIAGAAGQPLDAITAALDGGIPDNAGFLRPQATLAILVVTNRDDASLAQPLPPGDPIYAAAADGWTCTPPIDGTPQVHTGCTASSAPTYLRRWQDAADLVASLEAFPEWIAVGVLRGAPAPVEVVAGPAIAPSCGAAGREATPGLRLDAVAQRFPHHHLAALCEGDLIADLAGFARAVADAANADEWTPPPPSDAMPDEPIDASAAGCEDCSTGTPTSGAFWLLGALGALLATRRRRAAGTPAPRGSRACTRSSRSRRRSSCRRARPARA